MSLIARLVLVAFVLLALPTGAQAQYQLSPGSCAAGTAHRYSGTAWSCETIPPLGAPYWTSTANATLTGETDLGALTTGLLLNTVSGGVGTPSAYAGASCTNQFLRSLNASGAGTCADVAAADFASQTANTVLAGPAAAPAADPTFRALVDADIPSGIVRSTRTLNTTSPITGGGDLSADRTVACATCGVTGSPLSQFAATTSLQLLGVLSDETGTGALVFGTAPTIAGGTHTALTGFGVRSTGTGAFDLRIANTENLTVADKTLTIALNDADRTLTISGSATITGSNTGDQTITLTSDVTGSGTGSFATTIASDAVSNTKLANVATATFKGRTTAGTGDPEDLTTAQATALLDTFTSTLKGLVPSSGGGTTNFLRADGTWAVPSGGGGDSLSVNAIAVVDADLDDATPAAPAGAVNVTWQQDGGSPANVSAFLATNAVSNTVLRDSGGLSVIGRAANSTGDPADISATAATDAVLRESGSTIGFGTVATAGIANGAVDNTKLADMAQSTIKGRAVGAGTGDPTDLTTAQATAILDTFTSTLKGLAPSSGGGTTNFLRADGTWAAPGGGSDPWTYLEVNAGSDFTTTSATAVDVTGLTLTPSASTSYEIECRLGIRTAATATNPRVGFAWSTGLTDGFAMIEEAQAATSAPFAANGNINAALLIAAGGLPNTTQSWPVRIFAAFRAGATPSGATRVQLASETSGTTVRIVTAGSFCRWRTHAF